jgi:hypothetical protein
MDHKITGAFALFPPSFYTAVQQLDHLQTLELKDYVVGSSQLLELVNVLRKRPVKINSVRCTSWWSEANVPTDKVQQLREVPGYQVELCFGDEQSYFAFYYS